MKDIEVGDKITSTYDGAPVKIITVAKVVSRRGRVRRVIGDDNRERALRISDDGTVCEVAGSSSWSHHGCRRTLPDDEKTILEATIRARLREHFKSARINDWPMEDVWRVLDAWPKAVKS